MILARLKPKFNEKSCCYLFIFMTFLQCGYSYALKELYSIDKGHHTGNIFLASPILPIIDMGSHMVIIKVQGMILL